VRFAGLNPEEFFPKPSVSEEIYGAASPEKLQQLYDSLESINFVIRRETDAQRLKNLKDTQKNLWQRISSTQNAISKTEAPKNIKEEEGNLIDKLIKGISITAAILLAIIIFLLIKITRRSKEVEKVTERLKSLQTEPAPPPPLGGLDPTVFSTRFRQQAPLPQVKPLEQAPEPPKLRKTAKQRVTEAVQRMVEALKNIRKDGTIKTQTSNSLDSEKLTKTNIRVPSLNSTKISPPADETTYDRRSREKKEILNLARRGFTPSEIAKHLSLPRDQIETVIRLARERGE
jgi:DNA-directed RNA polymerase specialized sigma24 family protein